VGWRVVIGRKAALAFQATQKLRAEPAGPERRKLSPR
jgi:hypothetical protein